MSPLPSPETKAIVRAAEAAEALTTEVRRIADALTTPVTTPELEQAQAAIDRVRRLCDMTITASVRTDAIDQAHDTLAALDRAPGPDATTPTAEITALYERWVAAGPPPLGTSVARWWDSRLLELCAAINGDGPDPKEV